MKRLRLKLECWVLLTALFCIASPTHAQEKISVNVAVEKQEVVVGEPFRFRIQIEGTNDVQPPDFASLTDKFDVEFLGGTQNNSQSITIINGQTTEVVRRGFYLDYRLRARAEGTWAIPSAAIIAAGKEFTTQKVPVKAVPPQPNEDFFLTAELSQDTCYLGEAVYVTTILYVGKPVRDVAYSMPMLALDALDVETLPLNQEDFELVVNGERVAGEQGQAVRDGASFITLTFRHALIPRVSGTIELPKSTVSGQAATGRRVRSGSFFGGSAPEYETVVVAAEPMTLTVKPLPEAGRPDNFTGLVGQYRVAATASPTTVNVGDPITLNVIISGPTFLDNVEFPPLQEQAALAGKFRVHEETAPGVVEGRQKRFTQTIRAEQSDITEIPPIRLSYFDSRTGRYETAASEAIPLTVRETTQVTAANAEGYNPVVETVEHVAVNEGIAHNYTDASALTHQRFGPNVWLRSTGSWLFLLLPPLIYATLAVVLFLRARGGLFLVDRRHTQALPNLESALNSLDAAADVHGPLLDLMRTYLGTRLDRQASALTFADAEAPLRSRGVGESTIAELKQLFEACEAHRYAGGSGVPTENKGFVARVRSCARTLDGELGR